MKQDTKKLVLIGGAALAALYAYSTMGGEDYAGMGGGGGLPLLPTLPEAVGVGAAPTIVNIPEMKPPIDWGLEEGKGFESQIRKYIHPDDVEPLLQKKISVETYLDIVPPGEYTEAPITDPKRVYGSLGGKESKADIKKVESKPWYAPWTWDTSEAVKNYQAWATRSTERTLGISKTDKRQTTTIMAAKKIEGLQNKSTINSRSSFGSFISGRNDAFTRMGERSYTGARSAALSSVKKAQTKPGAPD